MFKMSEIISKEVISIYESESVGTIKNAILNKKLNKILGFVFFNEETDADSFIRTNNIYSLSEDGLLIRNITKAEFLSLEENSPINKKVFTLQANDFGRLSDFIIDEKGNVLKFVTSNGQEIKPNNLINIGTSVCIAKNEDEKIGMGNFKPKNSINTKENILESIKVKIVKMGEDNSVPQGHTIPKLPLKVRPNINSLIGRKVSKTITGKNNEIIIKQQNVITEHTLNMAKIHNKTNELIFNVVQ